MNAARLFVLTMLIGSCAAIAADTAKLPAFELKNRSSFSVERGTRVPFWPIGWSKDKPRVIVATPAEVKAFKIQPDHFVVSSVMLAHPPLATINGRAFGEGEYLPVEVGGQPVKVVVKAIRDGGVWLDQTGHQVFVPMRRQKLAPRQASDAPLAAPEFTIKIEEKR